MRIEIQEKGIFAMYSFQNDYSEGAHPNILRALETINYHQNNSYGLDEHSDNARELIQEALEVSKLPLGSLRPLYQQKRTFSTK